MPHSLRVRLFCCETRRGLALKSPGAFCGAGLSLDSCSGIERPVGAWSRTTLMRFAAIGLGDSASATINQNLYTEEDKEKGRVSLY